jgi:hypothetical protein
LYTLLNGLVGSFLISFFIWLDIVLLSTMFFSVAWLWSSS